MAGMTAFREAFMNADSLDTKKFGDFEARRLRYQVLWAFYENSVYRQIHSFSKLMKAEYGLYRFVRNIYNPSHRISEFWRSHLIAGGLDPEAGDGSKIPTALPIITENEAIRLPISAIWRWSNWEVRKDTLALWGTVLGDVFLRVIDNPSKERVYLSITHPGTIKELTKDDSGNIKAYTIEEERLMPGEKTKTGVYREVARRDGDNVVYETYMNDHPFVSNYIDNGSGKTEGLWTWSVPYGFIPMVHIQHDDVGLDWGWSELHANLPKFREADDVVSKLNDQIRKMVDAPWLFSGVDEPKKPLTTSSQAGTDQNPEKGRETVPILYAKQGAEAKALVADLDIEATSSHINGLLKEIEREYPELTVDVRDASADISGRALRLHRQPVEDKVRMRRPNYYNGICRATMMALSIGGFRQYEGFTGINLDSYAAGNLALTIGDTLVFNKDPQDEMDAETALWTAANQAKTAGIPLPVFLKRRGWTDEQIKEITESEEYKARMDAAKAAADRLNQLGNSNEINDPKDDPKKED